jgi:hypothetical protein
MENLGTEGLLAKKPKAACAVARKSNLDAQMGRYSCQVKDYIRPHLDFLDITPVTPNL